MSTNQFDDLDLDDDLEGAYGDDLVKKLRKQLSAVTKTLKEREAQVNELMAYTHEQTVAQMLQGYGLNPRISQFIPDDVQTQDDLEEWLDAYGDVFGIEAVDSGSSYENDPQAQVSDLMSSVEEGAVDPSIGYDIASKLENASSPEELLNILRG